MLSDQSILAAMRDKAIILEPEVDIRDVQPASIDVHLGDRLMIFLDKDEIDPRQPQPDLVYVQELDEEGMRIMPNEFLLGSTVETLTIDGTLACDFTGKSSLARLGLMVHVTAGYIDPGFSGKVTLEIKNLNRNPIRLYPGMKIGQFKFFRLDTTCLRPYGSPGLGSHYQGQSDVTASRSWA